MRRLVLAAALVLAACGDPTKEDLLAKAEGVQDKATLRARLGAPQDIAKLGPLETWTYRASNGEVVFVIAGDHVALQAAGSANSRK
jgi:hypothetical protein